VQKLFPTREAAEEHAAQAVLTARTKTMPDLPTSIHVRRVFRTRLPCTDARQAAHTGGVRPHVDGSCPSAL